MEFNHPAKLELYEQVIILIFSPHATVFFSFLKAFVTTIQLHVYIGLGLLRDPFLKEFPRAVLHMVNSSPLVIIVEPKAKARDDRMPSLE